jgi:acyl-CoA synthetase (AMP-forming)/AMP-acid ligase II
VHFPDTARRDRAIDPSYSNGVSHKVTHLEPVTLTLSLGAIAANGSQTVSGSQQLSVSSLALDQTDTATLLFANVSVTAPANVIVSHPALFLSTNQGTPVGGRLAAGQTYANLAMTASIPCYSIAGSSAGVLTLTATLLLLGTSTQ